MYYSPLQQVDTTSHYNIEVLLVSLKNLENTVYLDFKQGGFNGRNKNNTRSTRASG